LERPDDGRFAAGALQADFIEAGFAFQMLLLDSLARLESLSAGKLLGDGR
jgi:hypothetical protein